MEIKLALALRIFAAILAITHPEFLIFHRWDVLRLLALHISARVLITTIIV
jgi:hypothetical protein